ncbi:hypothetical protein H4R20_001722, partial [Coemansia guatemalensis]
MTGITTKLVEHHSNKTHGPLPTNQESGVNMQVANNLPTPDTTAVTGIFESQFKDGSDRRVNSKAGQKNSGKDMGNHQDVNRHHNTYLDKALSLAMECEKSLKEMTKTMEMLKLDKNKRIARAESNSGTSRNHRTITSQPARRVSPG